MYHAIQDNCIWEIQVEGYNQLGMNDQIITVQCECGQAHQFAKAHVGKRAKCPSLGKRFKVPAVSSPVEFLHESEQARARRRKAGY